MKLNSEQRKLLVKVIDIALHDNNRDGFSDEQVAELELLKSEIGKYTK